MSLSPLSLQDPVYFLHMTKGQNIIFSYIAVYAALVGIIDYTHTHCSKVLLCSDKDLS